MAVCISKCSVLARTMNIYSGASKIRGMGSRRICFLQLFKNCAQEPCNWKIPARLLTSSSSRLRELSVQRDFCRSPTALVLMRG